MLRFLVYVALALNVNAFPHDPLEEVKIVNGKPVEINQYSYQVALLNNNLLFCGGSIISPTAVLTAAHCIFYATGTLTVHAGTAFWAKPGSVHHVVSNITFSSDDNNDIGILHVAEPFAFDETRQPIQLFDEDEIAQTDALVHVTGWGLTGESGTPLDQLEVVEVHVVDRDVCKKDYEGFNVRIGPAQVCAGDAGRGPCRGDSGGALVYNNKQLGVVSLGVGCADPKYPTIYTNVAFYRKWISEHLSP